MGNFYANLSIRTDKHDAVVAHLNNVPDKGVVAPAAEGWVSFSTEQIETQDEAVIDEYGAAFSRVGMPVFAVTNHDDDVLTVLLYQDDRRVGHINTNPGYFAGTDDPAIVEGADAFAALADSATPAAIQAWAQEDHLFAIEAHEALRNLLRLPPVSVGFGYKYFNRGEFGPDGFTRTGTPGSGP